MADPTRDCWLLNATPELVEGSRARKVLGSLPGGPPVPFATGDRVVFYVAAKDGFAGAAEVVPAAEVGLEPIGGPPDPVCLKFRAVCKPGDLEPAGPLRKHLKAPPPPPDRGWPQPFGPIPEADYDLLRVSCRAREIGKPRPPGAPYTEAEKRPKIPAKVQKPAPKKPAPPAKKPTGKKKG